MAVVMLPVPTEEATERDGETPKLEATVVIESPASLATIVKFRASKSAVGVEVAVCKTLVTLEMPDNVGDEAIDGSTVVMTDELMLDSRLFATVSNPVDAESAVKEVVEKVELPEAVDGREALIEVARIGTID